MRRVLLLATTTGYQTRAFGEAAQRLGVALVFATDRCDQLDDPWWDGAIPIRFHEEAASVDAVVAAAERAPIDGILAVGDRPAVIAARVARRLGLKGHSPAAAQAARDKRLTRERLRDRGLPAPRFAVVSRRANPRELTPPAFPAVVKPASLSGSRGVIRVDDQAAFVDAFDRITRLLSSLDVLALRDPAADALVLEEFIDGCEYALEGLLHEGELQALALFDKPDPLDGPFFEETIYTTPSRAAPADQARIRAAVADAVAAIGLSHGPIHAECRVNPRGVFVLEVAARPIGGLCARALTFEDPEGRQAGLEELLLRHALGDDVRGWRRERLASGVMMIPIPGAGVFRGVDGQREAAAVPGVCGVHITAKPDQQLIPLPEGASYLGFIFARAEQPGAVEEALRQAHAHLAFSIDRAIAVR